MIRAMPAAAALFLALTVSATAGEPPTSEERRAVLQALEKVGCHSPEEIERERYGYEVDDAICRDGVYDFDLDRNFRIIDRDRD